MHRRKSPRRKKSAKTRRTKKSASKRSKKSLQKTPKKRVKKPRASPLQAVRIHRPPSVLETRLAMPVSSRRSYRSSDLPTTLQTFSSQHAQYRMKANRCELHGSDTQKCAMDPYCRMSARGCEFKDYRVGKKRVYKPL